MPNHSQEIIKIKQNFINYMYILKKYYSYVEENDYKIIISKMKMINNFCDFIY